MTSVLGRGTARRLQLPARRLRQRVVYTDAPILVLLSALLLVITAAALQWPEVVPLISVVVPMVIASLWLGPRTLPWFVIAALACVVVLIPGQTQLELRGTIRVVLVFVIGVIILLASFRRSRLGIAGARGESMLLDLSDRLMSQSRIPEMPRDWYVEAVLHAAGGTQFAGDFMVADSVGNGLDMVVVDVSGKGVSAGTRSLLLSGAFGALQSAVEPYEFLPAANSYLLRQEWHEGFATAIHVHLDLGTGEFELRKAGHPPALWLHAGSGTWSVLDSDGPALGLIDGAGYEVIRGTLRQGDGLLLYTDGLVENPSRDISSGIDKLAGQAIRMLRHGFDDRGAELLGALGERDDDRLLLLVHRRWA